MLDAVVTDGSKPGWVSLDVTGAVVDWHSHQHRPMALMIKVEDDRQRELFSRSVMQTITCDNGNITIMQIKRADLKSFIFTRNSTSSEEKTAIPSTHSNV